MCMKNTCWDHRHRNSQMVVNPHVCCTLSLRVYRSAYLVRVCSSIRSKGIDGDFLRVLSVNEIVTETSQLVNHVLGIIIMKPLRILSTIIPSSIADASLSNPPLTSQLIVPLRVNLMRGSVICGVSLCIDYQLGKGSNKSCP